MAPFDFDYFVVGGGSGGVRSARVAARHGARVGIAERRHWGGTCVNVGCVPKKLFTIAAHFATDFREAAAFGWDAAPPAHRWERLIAGKDREIARLQDVYRHLLLDSGCTLFEAHARLLDAHTLEVDGRRVTADKILLAVGGWPLLPDTPGVREFAITSNEVFDLPAMPRSIVLVGGGYIGAEFASVFAGLGARASLVCRSDALLRGFDADLGAHLARELGRAGVDVRLETDVTRIDRGPDGLVLFLSTGDAIVADRVVYAVGRVPHVAELGLDAAGLSTDAEGAIIVDAAYRTSAPNIFAVGDVTNHTNLTPAAVAEGEAVAEALFGDAASRGGLRHVPTAVFSDPPVASVGLSEADARQLFPSVEVYRKEFRPLRHAITGRPQSTLQKLVVDRDSDRVLGVHMVGSDAPEIIQGFTLALNCGATKALFDATLGVHPTSAEEFVSMRSRPLDAPRAERPAGAPDRPSA